MDINEGLENTLIILRYKLRTGIAVIREYDQNLPQVTAHGSELNQVWTNLIDNAADSLAGSGNVVLRTRSDDQWVVVEVEDDGPGIPKDLQPKIFTLFFTTKPLGKGTGLGLGTAYNIVRHHGGSIDFSSHPGKTVFTVCLPVEGTAPATGEAVQA